MMLTTLLASTALLALLPLAQSACPCPPAPAASQVCGSDHRTYSSHCDLTCTALPGVTLAHPGPCSPVDAARARVFNTSLLTSGRARRSPEEPVTWEKYKECCRAANVHCYTADWTTYDLRASMLQLAEECECLGFQEVNQFIFNHDQWNECKQLTCHEEAKACWRRCHHGRKAFQKCKESCNLASMRCSCECTQTWSRKQSEQDSEEASSEEGTTVLPPFRDMVDRVGYATSSVTAAAPRPALAAASSVLLGTVALLTAWQGGCLSRYNSEL